MAVLGLVIVILLRSSNSWGCIELEWRFTGGQPDNVGQTFFLWILLHFNH